MEHFKLNSASFSENASLHLLGTSWSKGFYSDCAINSSVDRESSQVPVKRRKLENDLYLKDSEYSNYSIGSRPLSDVFESSYNYLMTEDIMTTYSASDLLELDPSDSQTRPALIDFKKRFKELIDWIAQIQKRADRDKSGCCRSENLLEHDFYHELWQRREDFESLIKFANDLKEKEPDMRTELTTYIHDLKVLWEATEVQCKSPSFRDNPAPVLRDIAEDVKEVQRWLNETQSEFPAAQQWRMQISNLSPAERQDIHRLLATRQNSIEKYSRIINTVIKLIDKIAETNHFPNSNQSNTTDPPEDNSEDWNEIFERVRELHHLAQRLRRDCNQVWLHSLELICCLDDVAPRPVHLTRGNKQYMYDQVVSTSVNSFGIDSSQISDQSALPMATRSDSYSRPFYPSHASYQSSSLTVASSLKAHNFADINGGGTTAFSSSLGKESGFESEISPAPVMSRCLRRHDHTDMEETLSKFDDKRSSQGTSREGSLDILPFSEDEYEKILATSREDIFSCDDLSSLEGKIPPQEKVNKRYHSSFLSKSKMRPKTEGNLEREVQEMPVGGDFHSNDKDGGTPTRSYTVDTLPSLITCSETNLTQLKTALEGSIYQMNGPHSMDFAYLCGASVYKGGAESSPKHKPTRRLSRPDSRFYQMTAVDHHDLSDTRGHTSDSEDNNYGERIEVDYDKENVDSGVEHLPHFSGEEICADEIIQDLITKLDPPLTSSSPRDSSSTYKQKSVGSRYHKRRSSGRKRRYESVSGCGNVMIRTSDPRLPYSRSTLERLKPKSISEYISGDNWSCPSASEDETTDWKDLVRNLTVDNSNRNNQILGDRTRSGNDYIDSADNSSRERAHKNQLSIHPNNATSLSVRHCVSDIVNKKSYVQAAVKAEALLHSNRLSSQEDVPNCDSSMVDQLGWDNYQSPLYDPNHLNDYEEEECLSFQWDEHMDDSLTESILLCRRPRGSPCGAENPEREYGTSTYASGSYESQDSPLELESDESLEEDISRLIAKHKVKSKALLSDRNMLLPVITRSKKLLRRCKKTLDRRVPVGEMHDIVAEVKKLQDLTNQTMYNLSKLISLKQVFDENHEPQILGAATPLDQQQIFSLMDGWTHLQSTLQKKLSSARSLAAIYAQANTIKQEVEHVSQLLDVTSSNQLRDKTELDKHANSLKHCEARLQDWIGEISYLTDEVSHLPPVPPYLDPTTCCEDKLNDLKAKVQSLAASSDEEVSDKSRSLLMKLSNVSQRCDKIQELCQQCDSILVQCRHDVTHCQRNASQLSASDEPPSIRILENVQSKLIDCEIRLSNARNICDQTSSSFTGEYHDATSQQLDLLFNESKSIDKDCTSLIHQLKRKQRELKSNGATQTSLQESQSSSRNVVHGLRSLNDSNTNLYYFLVGMVGMLLAGFVYIMLRAKLIIHPQITYDKPPPV